MASRNEFDHKILFEIITVARRLFLTIFAAAAAVAGDSAVRRFSDGGSAAFGRRFGGAHAAAAAAAKRIRGGWGVLTDVRFKLDLMLISNSI